MKTTKTLSTKKVITQTLIIIQGIITAVLAIAVSYGILTNQF